MTFGTLNNIHSSSDDVMKVQAAGKPTLHAYNTARNPYTVKNSPYRKASPAANSGNSRSNRSPLRDGVSSKEIINTLIDIWRLHDNNKNMELEFEGFKRYINDTLPLITQKKHGHRHQYPPELYI